MVKGVVVHYLRWQALCQSQVLRNAPLNDPRSRKLAARQCRTSASHLGRPSNWLETSQELIHFLDKGLDCFHGSVEGFLLLRVQFQFYDSFHPG